MDAMEETPVAAKHAAAPPELAGPKAPAKRLSFFAALRAMNDNPLATIPMVAYEQSIWKAKDIFATQLLVSDPAGIKRILVDNVANYPKTSFDVRILGATFGDGLLTSGGEKWRGHRRVMSPPFDHRSIASYAPIITDATEAQIETWNAIGENAEIDIARDMATLTLKVISRTMFSADSDTLQSRLDDALRKGLAELSFGLQHIVPVIGPFLLNRHALAPRPPRVTGYVNEHVPDAFRHAQPLNVRNASRTDRSSPQLLARVDAAQRGSTH
jgi:cytochrome P450